jgi:hypothetical protein
MNDSSVVFAFCEGIFKDVQDDLYHSERAAVSSSGLKRILRSPAHFVAMQNSPEESTAALAFGKALHAALLEPAKFRERYMAKPELDRRTKAGRELAQLIDAACEHKTQISQEWLDEIDAMVEAGRRHPQVAQMTQAGEAEVSYVWRDEETGILCKCRPDWLNAEAIWDVKTCADASPAGFSRACAKYMYHVSAAFYVEGVFKLTGRTLPFRFVASEKDAPYAVAVYEASAVFLRTGGRLVRQALNRLRACRGSGKWPSYQPDGGIEQIGLPGWA